MLKVERLQSPDRLAWQKTAGFTYVSDVTLRVMESIEKRLPLPIGRSKYYSHKVDRFHDDKLSTNLTSLSLVTQELAQMVPSADQIYAGEYGVEKEEYVNALAYANGIGEMRFTWHFAPALAAIIVQQAVREGQLSDPEQSGWTLADWAEIIGSDWFSRLAHAMAQAGNNTYRDFGERGVGDFNEPALRTYLRKADGVGDFALDEETSLFTIKRRSGDPNDIVGLSVLPTPQLRELLHATMAGQVTNGCPVARFRTHTRKEMIENDPHAKSLIERGWAYITHTSEDDYADLRLVRTPIEVSLATLASKLHQYDDMYGTPCSARFDDGYEDGYPTIGHYKDGKVLLAPANYCGFGQEAVRCVLRQVT